MEKTKNSKFLAYFVSFLVMVAGAAAWALLYFFGVFSAWIAVASSYLALITFQKYYETTKITFAWIVSMTLLTNIASIFLMLLYSINKLGLTFTDFLNTPAALKSFIQDICLCVLFCVIGLVVCILVYRSNQNRKKLIISQRENNNVPSFVGTTPSKITTQLSEEAIAHNVDNKYELIIESLKILTKAYIENNDKKLYSEQISKLYEQHIPSMNQTLKDALLSKATADLANAKGDSLQSNTYRLAIKLLGDKAPNK